MPRAGSSAPEAGLSINLGLDADCPEMMTLSHLKLMLSSQILHCVLFILISAAERAAHAVCPSPDRHGISDVPGVFHLHLHHLFRISARIK